MNFADSDEMSAPLLRRGFTETQDLEKADAVLVNTCTIRDHAEHKAVSLIGKLRAWKNGDPDRFLIVTGCAAERLQDSLHKRFPHIDLVVGAKSIEDFPALLDAALKKRYDWAGENEGVWPLAPLAQEGSRRSAPGRPTAESILPSAPKVLDYVTIMRGCNYSCTYCIVPAVRGRESYRPFDTIVDEVKRKVAAGTREIMLLGQTVNSYKNGGRDFADLLRAVDAVDGLERIRYVSPHPFYLTERGIAAMADCKKVARHLHLPVQSGSDRMLGLMRRNYTRAMFLERLAALRAAVPEIAVSTDIIVGFPQETEEDFELTLSLVREARFSGAFCFKYSVREGTDAARMDGKVPESVIEERHARLLDLVERQAVETLEAWVGRDCDVLVEETGFGKSQWSHKLRLDQPVPPGRMVRSRISKIEGSKLYGTVLV